MRNPFLATSVCLTMFGCTPQPQAATHAGRAEAASVATTAVDTSKNKVIVQIVSQEQTIIVTSSPTGLLYSLKDASGNLQIADASETKFAELQPELFRNIKSYIAVHADDSPAIADGPEGEPWSGLDAPNPRLKANMNGGVTSGAVGDQFHRTSERPFLDAREHGAD